jgi:A1 cistron-splicing factor AAR2
MAAVLLLLETPPNLSLRIDNATCEPGPLFKGIKGLPAGPHYCVYSSDRAGISKSSFFFYAKPRDVLVKKWSAEDLEYIALSEAETECFTSAAAEFDRILAQYPLEAYPLWQDLTKYVRVQVLHKVEPVSRQVWSVEREVESTGRELEALSTARGGFFFTEVPRRRVKFGMSAAEITMSNFDKSLILQDLLASQYALPHDILGELQLAFLAFVLGENYQGLMQWKDLIDLLCNCEAALQTMPTLFYDFIRNS